MAAIPLPALPAANPGGLLVLPVAPGAVVNANDVCNAGGAAAPAWFAPAFAAAFTPFGVMMHNLSARQMNANATRGGDALLALQVGPGGGLALGAVPPGFPATRGQMANLTVPAATALLNAYGILIPAGALRPAIISLLQVHCNVPQPDLVN